jgi:hypothetical protein
MVIVQELSLQVDIELTTTQTTESRPGFQQKSCSTRQKLTTDPRRVRTAMMIQRKRCQKKAPDYNSDQLWQEEEEEEEGGEESVLY